MIPKTLELLAKIAPGTFVPAAEPCYDEAEIKELALILKSLLYSPSELRKRLQSLGVNVVPANFYSEIPLIVDIERTLAETPQEGTYDAIFDAELMSNWLAQLDTYAAEFDAPLDLPPDDPKYRWNCQFSFSDATAYHCFVRLLKPKTILEIGSGYSTLIARDACDKNGQGSIVCIEPFPRPFLRDLKRTTLLEKPVQEIDSAFFNDTLTDGDILFIDSTHTVKHGSDCLHLYLSILPQIKRNITVHVHDIYLPRPVPVRYLRDIQIYWTEQYLLYAYLLENDRAQVLYGSSYNFIHHKPRLDAFMNGRHPSGGASLWFNHRGAASVT